MRGDLSDWLAHVPPARVAATLNLSSHLSSMLPVSACADVPACRVAAQNSNATMLIAAPSAQTPSHPAHA